jgi:hypothetical protein
MADFLPAVLAVLVAASGLAAIAVLAGQLAMRRWKWEFTSGVGASRASLDGDRAALAAARQDAALYEPSLAAPYGPLATRLHGALTEATGTERDVSRRRTLLLRRLPSRPAGRVRGLWFAAVIEPVTWWRIHRRSRAPATEKGAGPGEIQALLDELRALPLTTAGRIVAARRASQDAAGRLRLLRSAGLHGGRLDAADREVAELAAEIDALPDWQPQYAPQTSSAETIESVIDAWEVLDRAEGPLEQHIEQLGRWQAELADLREKLSALQAAVAACELVVGLAPAAVALDELHAELAAARADAQELATLCAQPAVEALSRLSIRLSTVTERMAALTALCAGLAPQLERLRSALATAGRLLDQAETRIDDLAHEAAWPVKWGQHRDELVTLRALQMRIGPSGERRTPEKLAEHSRKAEQLAERAQELWQQIVRVKEQRETLIALLRRPEISEAPWLETARTLGREIAPYAAANWPAQHGAERLVDDAEALASRLRAAAVSAGEGLPAVGLAWRIEEVRRVSVEIEPLEQRIKQIGTRLAALQAAERRAREELEPVQHAVAELAARLHRSRVAAGGLLRRELKALDASQRKGQAILQSLAEPGNGLVEEKARQARSWTKIAQRDVDTTLQGIETHAERACTALAETAGSLRQIAPLDGEPAMRESGQLLSARAARQGARSTFSLRRSHSAHLLTRTAETETVLQEWQQAEDLTAALRTHVEQPLQESMAALEKARRQAQDRMGGLDGLRHDVERGWPPFVCDTDSAARRLRAARDEEERLHGSGRTVDEVSAMVERISDRYAGARTEADGIYDRVRREQEDLLKLAAALERWQDCLSRYRAAHAQESAVAAALDERIAYMQAETNRLRQRWQRRAPEAREAREGLRQVWQEAREEIRPEGGHGLRARDIELDTR